MPFQLVFTQGYERLALKFLKQHPELKNQYFKTLSLLELNPYHPSLRLHALSGKLQHLHSVSINLSYRIHLGAADSRPRNYSHQGRRSQRCVLTPAASPWRRKWLGQQIGWLL